jgi:AcrR family transcriptional regulator
MNIAKAVENSMLDLIETNRLENITIEMICEHAEVSKTSFYRYFKDKYDLVNQIYDSIMPSNIDQTGKNIKWTEMMMIIFDSLGKNRNFLRQAYLCDDFNDLKKHTFDFNQKIIRTLIENKGGGTKDPDVEFSIWLFSDSIADFQKNWIATGGGDTKENLIRRLRRSVPYIIYPYFD